MLSTFCTCVVSTCYSLSNLYWYKKTTTKEYPTFHINTLYYTSREDTLILLDESHVSKMLATCFSVGSLTAVTI